VQQRLTASLENESTGIRRLELLLLFAGEDDPSTSSGVAMISTKLNCNLSRDFLPPAPSGKNLARLSQPQAEMTSFKGLTQVSVGMMEAFTRSKSVEIDFTGWTGIQILDMLERLKSNDRITPYSLPLHDQVRSLQIHADGRRDNYRDVIPAGAEDAGRRVLVANLLRPGTPPSSEYTVIVKKAEEDVGYAYCQGYLIDGPVMVAALLCPNLVRLVVDIGSQSFALEFSQLLATVLEADEALSITRWPGLKYLDISMGQESVTLIVPLSVEELTLRNATDTSFTTVHPSTGTLPSSHSKMRRLTVHSSVEAAPGDMVSLVRTLIETDTLPLLACIQIIESNLHTSATQALLSACKTNLRDSIKEIEIDLLYRADDYNNVLGYNNHLQTLTPLPPHVLTGFTNVTRLSLSRYLLPGLMALGPYLAPHIESFCVLGGFGEEVEEIADQGQLRASKLWNGTLVIGIDYDLNGASTLVDKAEQEMHAV
jgi:hypothetical protein